MDDEEILDKALDAFWAVIAKSYPEAKSGDLSPGTDHVLWRASMDAVREWKRLNIPILEAEVTHLGPDT